MNALTSITRETFKDKEFNIVFFHANGCHHCEAAKPHFESLSKEFPNIGFYSIEFQDGKEHYDLFGEKTEDMIYEPVLNEDNSPKLNEDGSQITQATVRLDDNGQPVMVTKYSFPSFFVYHSEAASEENPWGFVGGFDGNNPEEATAVIHAVANYGR